MNPRLSSVALSVAAVAALLLSAGCAPAQPGSTAPESTATPVASATPAPGTDDDADDIEAAWLDGGRLFALVTNGSSSIDCAPIIGDVTADGQRVTVELSDPDGDVMCTADYQPRASIGGIPEGVDPTQDVELIVNYNGRTDDVDLDGNAALTGTPGTSTDYLPSAGWFDDEGLVLLTWGSSSAGCRPTVESVEANGAAATVNLSITTEMCTMDMAPRATLVSVARDDDDAEFILTLVGANLDGTVTVID